MPLLALSTLFPYTDALPISCGRNACRLGAVAIAFRSGRKSKERVPVAHISRISSNGRVRHRRGRSEEHTSELQSRQYLVCRLLLEKKKETDQHTLQARRVRR